MEHDIAKREHDIDDMERDVFDVEHGVTEPAPDVVDMEYDVADQKHDVADPEHEIARIVIDSGIAIVENEKAASTADSGGPPAALPGSDFELCGTPWNKTARVSALRPADRAA